MSARRRILVIRNDKLGDFMLAWPALALLKKQYPDSEISVLVPEYTRPMAELCPWIDNVVVDVTDKSPLSGAIRLARRLRERRFDAVIALFTETHTALACMLAGIPVRVAPATKLARLFSNRKLKQKRSESAKPEHEYNTDLIRFFITLNGDQTTEPPQPPYLEFDTRNSSQLRSEYLQRHGRDDDTVIVTVHPGTGGSAINLDVRQFAELIRTIYARKDTWFIITAGPGEEAIAEQLDTLIEDIPHDLYYSREGIVSYSRFISIAQLFISGSTGTLHIAGALDIPTAAFYSARRSATSLRWQTLNSRNRRIAFSPDSYTNESDMRRIDIERCGRAIVGLLDDLYPQADSDTKR